MTVFFRADQSTVSLYLTPRNQYNDVVDADPGSVVLTLQDMGGTVQPGFPTTAVVHVATGLYAYEITTRPSPGRYRAIWTATLDGIPMDYPEPEELIVEGAVSTATVAFAAGADLRIMRGDTTAFEFALLVDGNALDLTGATIRFTAKRSLADSAAVFAKTIGDGLTVVDAGGGLVDLSFNPQDTRDLDAPATLVWDLEVTEASGYVSTPLIGTLRLDPDVREAGAGIASGLLVSTTAARALVKTGLDDDALADVIAREEAILAAEVGPLAGERVYTRVVDGVTAALPIRLPRPTSAVAVTENAVATADVRLSANGRTVTRLATTGWGTGSWAGPVDITFAPNDLARVTAWVIELVRARLAETGFDSETRGAYSYTRGTRTHDQVLSDAVADILGRGVARVASRRVRSGVMSSATATPWVGTSRP